MALVELLLSPLPSHVRTARLVGVAAARRAGLEDEHVDELRLAVGEAASRAVGLHARHRPDVPVKITVSDDPTGLVVTVIDAGPAAGPLPDDVAAGLLEGEETPEGEPVEITGEPHHFEALVDPDVSLAVLAGLVDDVQVTPDAGGTSVAMRWPLPVRPGGGTGPASTSAVRT